MKEYKWGRIMTHRQIGFMIGWGKCIIPDCRYISIELPFLIIQVYIENQ